MNNCNKINECGVSLRDIINMTLFMEGGTNDFDNLQDRIGYAQPKDVITSLQPRYRLFINNSNTYATFINYKDNERKSLIAPPYSIGMLFHNGRHWSMQVYTITKKILGLENVDNTSDVDKPISNAVQKALNEIEQAMLELGALGVVQDLNDPDATHIPSTIAVSNAVNNLQQNIDAVSLVAEAAQTTAGNNSHSLSLLTIPYVNNTDQPVTLEYLDASGNPLIAPANSVNVITPADDGNGNITYSIATATVDFSEVQSQIDAVATDVTAAQTTADGATQLANTAQTTANAAEATGTSALTLATNNKADIGTINNTLNPPIIDTSANKDFNAYTTPGRYAINVNDIYTGKWANSFYELMRGCTITAVSMQGSVPIITYFDVVKVANGSVWQIITFKKDLKIVRMMQTGTNSNGLLFNANIWKQIGDGYFPALNSQTNNYPNNITIDGVQIYCSDFNNLLLPGLKVQVFLQTLSNINNYPLNYPPTIGSLNGTILFSNDIYRNSVNYSSAIKEKLINPVSDIIIQKFIPSYTFTSQYTKRITIYRKGGIDYDNLPSFGIWQYEEKTLSEIIKINSSSVADVTIPAGTVAKPPFVFTAGVSAQNPPVNGALNYDGNHLYFTDNAGVTHQLAVVS